MDRRRFTQYTAVGIATAGIPLWAHAISLGDLSNKDAAAGLKLALDKGAAAAVALLGAPDGFLGNDKVRIPFQAI